MSYLDECEECGRDLSRVDKLGWTEPDELKWIKCCKLFVCPECDHWHQKKHAKEEGGEAHDNKDD